MGPRRKAHNPASSFTTHQIDETSETTLRDLLVALLLGIIFASTALCAQDVSPFVVSNPKNKKWPAEAATRIYFSTCELVARTVRPEKPPVLRPKFVLVLGSDNDEFVNLSPAMEVHLKSWNDVKFAEAVALIATRDVVHPDQMEKIVRQSVSLANSTVSVSQLKQNQ
jgi:hypothetical protein